MIHDQYVWTPRTSDNPSGLVGLLRKLRLRSTIGYGHWRGPKGIIVKFKDGTWMALPDNKDKKIGGTLDTFEDAVYHLENGNDDDSVATLA